MYFINENVIKKVNIFIDNIVVDDFFASTDDNDIKENKLMYLDKDKLENVTINNDDIIYFIKKIITVPYHNNINNDDILSEKVNLLACFYIIKIFYYNKNEFYINEDLKDFINTIIKNNGISIFNIEIPDNSFVKEIINNENYKNILDLYYKIENYNKIPVSNGNELYFDNDNVLERLANFIKNNTKFSINDLTDIIKIPYENIDFELENNKKNYYLAKIILASFIFENSNKNKFYEYKYIDYNNSIYPNNPKTLNNLDKLNFFNQKNFFDQNKNINKYKDKLNDIKNEYKFKDNFSEFLNALVNSFDKYNPDIRELPKSKVKRKSNKIIKITLISLFLIFVILVTIAFLIWYYYPRNR